MLNAKADWVVKCASANSSAIKTNAWWWTGVCVCVGGGRRRAKLISLLIGAGKALLITPERFYHPSIVGHLSRSFCHIWLKYKEEVRSFELKQCQYWVQIIHNIKTIAALSHHATDRNTLAVHPSVISIFLFLFRDHSWTLWLQSLCLWRALLSTWLAVIPACCRYYSHPSILLGPNL